MSTLSSTETERELLEAFERGEGDFEGYCRKYLAPFIKYLDKEVEVIEVPVNSPFDGVFPQSRKIRAVRVADSEFEDQKGITAILYLTRDDQWEIGLQVEDRIELSMNEQSPFAILGWYYAQSHNGYRHCRYDNQLLSEGFKYFESLGRKIALAGMRKIIALKQKRLKEGIDMLGQLDARFYETQLYVNEAAPQQTC